MLSAALKVYQYHHLKYINTTIIGWRDQRQLFKSHCPPALLMVFGRRQNSMTQKTVTHPNQQIP